MHIIAYSLIINPFSSHPCHIPLSYHIHCLFDHEHYSLWFVFVIVLNRLHLNDNPFPCCLDMRSSLLLAMIGGVVVVAAMIASMATVVVMAATVHVRDSSTQVVFNNDVYLSVE
jgi:hypothetical protein